MTKKISCVGLSQKELEGMHFDLSKELFQLRNEQASGGRIEKSHRVRQVRRDIARVLTALGSMKERAAR